MPVYRTPTNRTAKTAELTDWLADVLNAPDTTGQPFVVENPINGTRSLHVAVFWDDWGELSYPQRSKVILDAYDRHDAGSGTKITIALGVTGQEAIRMGLLPYKVECAVKPADAEARRRASDLMREHGAFETSSGPQLRFSTAVQARRAFSLLEEQLPAAQWLLAEEITASDHF